MSCEVKKLDPVLVEKLVRARAAREGHDENWVQQEIKRMESATAIVCSRKRGAK